MTEAVAKQAIGFQASSTDTSTPASEAKYAEMTTDAASTAHADERRCALDTHPVIRDHSPGSPSTNSPPTSLNRDQSRLDSKLSTKASAFSIEALLRRSNFPGNRLERDKITIETASQCGGSHFDVNRGETGDLCRSRKAPIKEIELPSSSSSQGNPPPNPLATTSPRPRPLLRLFGKEDEKHGEPIVEINIRGMSTVVLSP